MRAASGIAVVVGLVVLAIALLTTTVGNSEQQPPGDAVRPLLGPGPPKDFRVGPGPGDEEEQFQVPSLTEQDRARAKAILENDPRARALIRGHAYTITKMIPGIDSATGSNALVGALLSISLDQPISVEGNWVLVYPPGPEDPPDLGNQEVSVYFPDCAAPNGVREIMALVDLVEDKLVQFQPLGVPGFDYRLSYCEGS